MAGFWFRGRDAQAVFALNGPGPYILRDNYIEGSGENVLFGGATIRIKDCVPGNVEHRRQHPREARRLARAEGRSQEQPGIQGRAAGDCRGQPIDGNWKDGQDGSPILLTPRNQYGDTPWVVVEDVTIRGNVVRRTVRRLRGEHPGAGQRPSERADGPRHHRAQPVCRRAHGVRVVGGVDGALTSGATRFPRSSTTGWRSTAQGRSRRSP